MTAKKMTAGETAKRCAVWRTVKKNGRIAERSPDGRIFYGTAQKVREARLMPWHRDLLAISLRDVRRIYSGDSRMIQAADRRQFALCHNSTTPADLHIPATGCTPALLIRVRAAARVVGRSEADFVADALACAVDAAIEMAAGPGLPYTRRERDALARLGENPEKDETELQRIAAAIFGEKRGSRRETPPER